jgi:hypothetical protein
VIGRRVMREVGNHILWRMQSWGGKIEILLIGTKNCEDGRYHRLTSIWLVDNDITMVMNGCKERGTT